MSTFMITVTAKEKDGVQSINTHFIEIDDAGNTIPARSDKAIGILEKAKMQVLGKDFMQAAAARLDQELAGERAGLQAITTTLNAATDLNKKLLEAGVLDLARRAKKADKKKTRRQSE